MNPRLHPSLVAIAAMLIAAACLHHQGTVLPTRLLAEHDPRLLPDGSYTPEALFDFHLLVAAAFMDGGQPGVAAGELVEAAEACPEHPDARDALSRAAFAYERGGERTKARQTHERVVREYPDWQHLDLHWFRIGILAENERDLEGAQVAYEELVGNYFDAGERWDALFNLARIYEQRGMYGQAYAAYVKWGQENPEADDSLANALHAATLLSRMGNPAAERKVLSDFLDKQAPALAQRNKLAWTRARLRSLAEAGELTRRAADGGWSRTLPDGGPAARFTDFTPVPPAVPPPDSSCIGRARDGGCVFSFEEQADVRAAAPVDGGPLDLPPRLALADGAESVVLQFEGGRCSIATLVGDGGCWVQLTGIVQGDDRSWNHARYSVRGQPDFVACRASVELCDGRWTCDCSPRPPPGFTAMTTDGGERTGNARPKRRP